MTWLKLLPMPVMIVAFFLATILITEIPDLKHSAAAQYNIKAALHQFPLVLCILEHNATYDFMNIQPPILPLGINTGVTHLLLF